MSSSPASSSNVPQDHRHVHVLANLGAFGWPWVSAPSYNAPQTMLPFPLQFYQPHDPQYHLQPHNWSPSLLLSRELNPWGDAGIHWENDNIQYSDPITNEVLATLAAQDVALQTTPEDINNQFPLPPMCPYDGYAATPTAGPVRGPTRIKRPTSYSRPASKSRSKNMTTGAPRLLSLSALAKDRLSVQGVCRINFCGEIFSCADAYREHVRDVHEINSGRSGSQKILCPWEGCGQYWSKASLSNHVLGHNISSGCGVCDKTIPGARSDSMQKHYRSRHPDTFGKVLIPASRFLEYAYLFFHEEA